MKNPVKGRILMGDSDETNTKHISAEPIMMQHVHILDNIGRQTMKMYAPQYQHSILQTVFIIITLETIKIYVS